MAKKTPVELCKQHFPDECNNVSSTDLGGVPDKVNDNCQVCINAFAGYIPIARLDCSQVGTGTYKRLVNFDQSGCWKCEKGNQQLIEVKKPCKRCTQAVVSVKPPGQPGYYGVTATWTPRIPITNQCLECIVDNDPDNETGEKINNKCDEAQEQNDKSPKQRGKYTFNCETSGELSKCVRRCVKCPDCQYCKRLTDGDDFCAPTTDCPSPPRICLNDECVCPLLAANDKATYEALPEDVKPFYSLCPNSEPFLRLDGGCVCVCGCRKTGHDCVESPTGNSLGCRCLYYTVNTTETSNVHYPDSPPSPKGPNGRPCYVGKDKRTGKPQKKLVETADGGCACVPYDRIGPFSLDMIP